MSDRLVTFRRAKLRRGYGCTVPFASGSPIIALVLLLILASQLVVSKIRAQDVVLPGSTPQGDFLRGQGQFLKGMAWYEVGSAQSRAIDTQTMIIWNRAVQESYNQYLIERAQHNAGRLALRNARQQAAAKMLADTQRRWRLSPTTDDIRSGLALNALASDLADPSISASSWRVATVALPQDFSLPAMAFKITSAPGKGSKLQQSTVAVQRMTVGEAWPLPFRRPELAAQCEAYKNAIRNVVGKCEKGTPLVSKDFEQLREAVDALKVKAPQVVPTRDGLRTQAQQFVRQLDDATKIFADQEFAEELIFDMQKHEATTVAELMAFMRKYRLLFAEADRRPDCLQLYDALYPMLREQKKKLGLADLPPGGFGLQGSERPKALGENSLSLFDGTTLNGWRAFQDARPAHLGSSLVPKGGEIHCAANARGRIETMETFPAFILKFEYLFPGDGKTNAQVAWGSKGSGIALRYDFNDLPQVDGLPRKGEIEYQLLPGESGDLWVVGTNQKMPRQGDAERPRGEWNEAEIRYKEAILTFLLNGRIVNQAQIMDPRPLRISLLAQGSAVRFRKLSLVRHP